MRNDKDGFSPTFLQRELEQSLETDFIINLVHKSGVYGGVAGAMNFCTIGQC